MNENLEKKTEGYFKEEFRKELQSKDFEPEQIEKLLDMYGSQFGLLSEGLEQLRLLRETLNKTEGLPTEVNAILSNLQHCLGTSISSIRFWTRNPRNMRHDPQHLPSDDLD